MQPQYSTQTWGGGLGVGGGGVEVYEGRGVEMKSGGMHEYTERGEMCRGKKGGGKGVIGN